MAITTFSSNDDGIEPGQRHRGNYIVDVNLEDDAPWCGCDDQVAAVSSAERAGKGALRGLDAIENRSAFADAHRFAVEGIRGPDGTFAVDADSIWNNGRRRSGWSSR